jgi:hypothetical protein
MYHRLHLAVDGVIPYDNILSDLGDSYCDSIIIPKYGSLINTVRISVIFYPLYDILPKYGSLINTVRISVIFYPLYDILVDLLNQNLLEEQEEFFLVALDFLQAVFAAIQPELNDPE